MRPIESESEWRGVRNPIHAGSRAARARRARLRRVSLEFLESRTLLATLPAVTVTGQTDISSGAPTNPGGNVGNSSTPSVAVDPYNTQDMVAVWVRNDPARSINTNNNASTVYVELATSTNGGQTWTVQGVNPGSKVVDLSQSQQSGARYYAQTTDPSVAFNAQSQFYVLDSPHTADYASGAVAISKFAFNGGSPTALISDEVIYQWIQDPVYRPMLAVDSNVASQTDGSTTQSDPYVNNVYVAWSTSNNITDPANSNPKNPNVIKVVASSDGGADFSTPVTVNSTGNGGNDRDAAPQLVVSQGRPADPNDSNHATAVLGGQVSVIWDDTGTLRSTSTNQPKPLDAITMAPITNGGSGFDFLSTATPMTINQAIAPPSGSTVNTPQNTFVPLNVSFPSINPNTTFADLEVIVGLVNDLTQTSIELDLPNNLGSIILLRNKASADTSVANNANAGANGSNLGTTPASNADTPAADSNASQYIGTTFDDSAPRSILNNAGGNASTGHFRPETGSLDATIRGLTAAQLTGTWMLKVTDYRNNTFTAPAFAAIEKFGLTFTAGLTPGTNVRVATTGVLGAVNNNAFALTAPASPDIGIGPGAVIASDNTLGAFSPNQGRLYVAYTDVLRGLQPMAMDSIGQAVNNDPNNTDIFVAYSDNGGATWTTPTGAFGLKNPVNDDNATTDGFSQAGLTDPGGTTLFVNGRSQFLPSVAVDQTTGTLVVSFYDARNDASNARVANYIATSLDGGLSFGPETYVDPSKTATDAVDNSTQVVFGPIPENDSSGGAGGNSVKDATFAFGSHEGLVVTGGHVVPVWVSNQDGGNDGKKLQNIYTARVTIAAGPRIIDGTMGPVQSTTVTTTSGAITFNAPAANGTPQASGFVVTFDRPVDPASFTIGDVTISYRDTNPTDSAQSITASNVYPIVGSDPTDPDNNGHYGYTQFLVTFPAHSGLGTYSYSVGPSINARIRKPNQPAAIEPMDQNSNAITNQASDIFSAPTTSTDTSTLPLIVYGATVASTSVPGVLTADGSQTQVNNGLADALDLTFDRPMLATSFTPSDVLRMMGPTGLISGPFTVTPAFNSSVTPNSPVTIGSGGTATSSLPISGVGGFTIADLRVRLDITAQNDSELTAVLVPPPGLGVTPITLFSNLSLPATAAPKFTNTVFDDHAPVSILSALPPFTGSFQPVQSLDAALAGKTLAGNWSLQISDAAGGKGATLNSWSLETTPTAASTGALATTYRIGFPTQALSGTYTFQIASSVQDANGNPMDENQNAGLDVLRGFSPNGTQVQTTYSSTASVTIKPGTPTPPTPGVTTSTINVPASYPVQGVVVQLNLAYPNDPDLTVTLTAPNGKSAILFSNIGATGTHANFTNTVFDDNAATPISNGGPPFFGHFQPMSPFTTAFVSNPNNPSDPLLPVGSQGTWTLTITNSGTSTGTLTSWSLTLTQKIPNSGLGEPVADQASASFRIFTMDPTNPLSSNTWTAVGPTGIGGGGGGPEGGGSGGRSGRIGGLAVDPSDPSGNTVYIGGASGGVWKTTDFLTTDPGGPTYIPLTDFGPSFAINIGSIAVFGRNNDPNQSIIFAGTGEGDTGTPGVGFLRSMDGGATWTLLDSTTNVDSSGNPLPFNSSLRDHIFTKGTTTFKVVVDPKLSPSGDVIVYAALSGTNGGLWRSDDSGKHWQKLSVDGVQGTLATDVVLDPASGTGAPGGNLQNLYVAFRGVGVFSSANRGQTLSLMSGGIGNPLILDLGKNVNPAMPEPSPNGPGGRIELAKPALTGNAAEDKIYQGWLYAGVIDPSNHFQGLYLTKDFGQNWTLVPIPTLPPVAATIGQYPQAIPTNNLSQPNYDLGGGPAGTGLPSQGNYDFSLAIDPTNPNVVYMGGTQDGQPTGFIRIDTTGIFDAHTLVGYSTNSNDGGQLLTNSTGGVTTTDHTKNPQYPFLNNQVSYINFIRNPFDPFNADATLNVLNSGQFSNTGANVTWIPFDIGGTDQHRIVTMVDPLTGHARIIIGDDQGVFSAVDNNGTFDLGIGNAQEPDSDRNGNLQITQFYYGAAQPTNVAADLAQALFYGSTQDNGGPTSNPNIIGDPTQSGYGDLNWNGPGGDATGVGTDQQAGTVDPSTGQVIPSSLYQYWWPAAGGGYTNFFQVDGVGRTFGLIQGSGNLPTPDPEWPPTGGSNFTVNPLSGQQIVISSATGRIFETENQGQTWFTIAPPGVLDGTYAPATAYGAPDPSAPGYQGNLDSFIYVGTTAGNVFVTQTGGGGANGNQWFKISNGLDGSPIQQIITDPTRGSHRAYVVTANHVYYTPDSIALAQNPALSWINITGNLPQLKDYSSNQFGSGLTINDPTTAVNNLAKGLATVQADWRYVIPDDPTKPNGPTHPVLYVGGQAGVFRSTDNGQTWSIFPSIALDGSSQDGGYLPNASVTQLNIVLGNIDPTTGRAQQSTTVPDPNNPGKTTQAIGPDILMASTYGRGVFTIRLSPDVLGSLLAIDPATGVGTSNGLPLTSNTQPIIDGQSEQSAFGNTVTINLYDHAADPNHLHPIGTGATDANGKFKIQINAGVYKSDGSNDGLHVIDVQATDQSGARGNVASLRFILATQKPLPPTSIALDPSTDTGTLNNDGYTADNNSASHPAPLFNITGIESGAIVQLFRNGVLVNTVQAGLGGGTVQNPVQIADLNIQGGTVVNGMLVGGTSTPIPDNTGVNPPDTAPPTGSPFYTYTVLQIDAAGNVSPVSAVSSRVIIASTAPAPPTVVLDSNSDTGQSSSDGITADNNSAAHAAPGFDVSGVLPNSIVQLFRDNQFVGIVQAPPGNGLESVVVPDNLLGVIPDGQHSYTARQIDLAGNQGSMSNPTTVTIATATPASPTLILDPASTTNTVNTIAYTMSNNSAKFPAPVFDVSGVLPNAWVELFRNGTYVGFAQASNMGGTVKVADNLTGLIPDSPTSPALAPYQYTVKQVDVAGNQGTPSSPATQVVVDTTPPLNPPVVLDMLSDTAPFGTFNSDGITNEKTLSHFPVFDVGSSAFPVEPGATVNLYRNGKIVATLTQVSPINGVVQISDSSTIPDGTYTYGAQQRDLAGNYSGLGAQASVTYVTVAPAAPQAPALAPASQTGSVSGRTSVKNPTFNVGGVVAGDVLVLLRDGTKVATIFNAQPVGGLVSINDPGPVADGLHSYSAFQVDVAGNTSPIGPATSLTIGPDAPASVSLVSDSGTPGDDITNITTNLVFNVTGVPSGSTLELLRSGTLVKTLMNVQPVGGVVPITDSGPVQPDGLYKYTAVAVDAAGIQSPPSPALSVTIVTSVAQPGLALDPSSDSGIKGDGITNVKNPTFDITSAAQGAMISLSRVMLVNGVMTGSPTVVATITAGPGGTATITDPGPVPGGTYAYSVQQTDVAGNVSAASGQLTLTIITAIPAAPALTLDPSSQSGSATITANPRPTIDVGGVQLGATVKLFRNATLVKTVANASTASFTFTEPNALANGNVTYTVMQSDVAANTSPTSTLAVTVNTNAAPAAPTVMLDPASQSTSGVSGSTTVNVNLIFDVAGILPGATVSLFRGGTFIVSTASPAGGTVMITDPGPLNPGSYSYTAQQTSAANAQSPVGPAFALTITPRTPTAALVPDDFNGDGRTDVAAFGPGANGLPRFSFLPSGGGPTGTIPFGGTQDVFASGSFDGTGTSNVAVYGPGANGLPRLAYLPSGGGPAVSVTFGGPQDQFVSGDFNGDGRSDVAVYGYGRLAYIPSGGGPVVTMPFGQQGDVPVPGYYSGGVTTTFGVFRPSTDQWFIGTQAPVTYGTAGDIPVPGMYDTPGVTQIAVFRPSTDQWFISGHAQPISFGGPGDIPAPGEYDGGQKTVPAVFRPSTSQVFIYGHPAPISFGGPKDVSVSAPPEYQNVPISARSIAVVAAPASATVSSASVMPSTASSSLNLGATAAMLSARTLTTGPARPVKVRPDAGASKPVLARGVSRLLSTQQLAREKALSKLGTVRLRG